MDELAFIIIIIILVVIIIFFIVRFKNPAEPSIQTKQIIITPGGCAGTQYGCCPNSTVAKHDYIGSNCSSYNPIIITPQGGCAGTQYGCCPNSNIAKHDYIGSNCSSYNPPPPHPQPYGGCSGTQYGCCPDGITPKDANGLCNY